MENLPLPLLVFFVIIILVIQAIIIFILTKPQRAQKLSAKLTKATQENDLGEFQRLSKSSLAKFTLGELNLNYAEVQFYIMNARKDDLDKIVDKVIKLKAGNKEKKTILTQMWRYYLDREDQDKAEILASSLKTIYNQENNLKAKENLEFLMDIYIYANPQREEELIKMIKDNQDERRTLYQQHLANLYLKLGDEKKAIKILEKAKEQSSSKVAIEALILHLKEKAKKGKKKN
jgi:tetratricopeptide (TPR) repeat protein